MKGNVDLTKPHWKCKVCGAVAMPFTDNDYCQCEMEDSESGDWIRIDPFSQRTMRSNRMDYAKPLIEECEELEDVVFYAIETIYVFRSTGSWPAHYFFWTATEEAWLAGDYEFERRKY